MFTRSFSSGDHNGRGTKAIGLANSFVAVADNPWAIAYNPAGLTQLKLLEVSTFFVPQQFGLPELKTVSVAAAIPLEDFTAAVELEQFGFTMYKESTLRLGLGMDVDSRLKAGATINLGRLVLGNYGSTNLATFDVGLLGVIQEDIRIGFSARNLFGSRVGQTPERLPHVFCLGANYAPLRDLTIVIEMEKDARFPAIVKGGVEQSIFDFVKVRVGVSNNPDKFSAGVGLLYESIEFGYAGYSHVDLGWTHQIEVSFTLGGV